MGMKKYRGLWGIGLALLLLGWQTHPALGETPEALSTGVVATITTVDATTDTVTLQSEAGEVFTLPKGWRWQVGDKVVCERVPWSRDSQLQHCQPWK